MKTKKKKCTVCKKQYPATLVYFHKQAGGKDGLHSQCKVCRAIYRKKYLQTDGGKRAFGNAMRKYRQTQGAKNFQKMWRLNHKYNMTPKEYDKLYKRQKGCCAICGIHQSVFKKALCVDHNHITGEIRGLLCNSCNWAIGYLKVDKMGFDLLTSAIVYIQGL